MNDLESIFILKLNTFNSSDILKINITSTIKKHP